MALYFVRGKDKRLKNGSSPAPVSPAAITPRRLVPHPHLDVERLDAGSMRTRNRSMLLRAIWCAGATSRADLARESGLSRSAVSALVEELLGSGLVIESGRGASRGGRRPTMLEFADGAYAVTGVDMGATHVSVAVTDLRGEVRAWRRADCATRDDPQGAMAVVRRLVAGAQADAGVEQAQVLGVGLAVASPVDPQQPGRLPPLFMPAWRDVDLLRDLALPGDPELVIDNDANLGALAESWWGAGRDGADLVFIKLGTGVGAGFVLGGHIFRGHGGTAGEIGHLVIDPSGPLCVCGLQGCLTTFVGTDALLESAGDARRDHPGCLLPDGPIDVKHLIRAVQQGDVALRAVVARAAERLGLAVSGLLNLINPQTVVLGGELATIGDALLQPLRACVQQRSMWTAVVNSRIVASQLGERDVALGAATRIIQGALMAPSRFPVGWAA